MFSQTKQERIHLNQYSFVCCVFVCLFVCLCDCLSAWLCVSVLFVFCVLSEYVLLCCILVCLCVLCLCTCMLYACVIV